MLCAAFLGLAVGLSCATPGLTQKVAAPPDGQALPPDGQTPPSETQMPPEPSDGKCITDEGGFRQNAGAATFVIALHNNCEKRVRCTVNAYIVTAMGPTTGRSVLTLGPKSQGAAAHKSYVMKIKSAGGMANVARDCKFL
jgi:hypothetical protein